MKRLLVTGATGFIGRETLSIAQAAGFEVHGLSRSHGVINGPDGVIWSLGDLRNGDEAEALIRRIKPTHVLHSAWVTEHGAYWTSPDNLDWLAASARLLRSFVDAGGRRFVGVGTCAEYDWHGDGHKIEGKTPETPATFYGRMKLAHHHMLMAAAEQVGFSAATGRIFFVFGPRESPARVVAHACQSLAKRVPAVFSSGAQRRDFLPVSDAAHGLVALIDSDLSGAVNVSSGEARPLREIISVIGDIAGRPDLLRFDPNRDRPGDPPLICGDNSKLSTTGWRPKRELREALSEVYAHFKRE